jgi:hypothetical protein
LGGSSNDGRTNLCFACFDGWCRENIIEELVFLAGPAANFFFEAQEDISYSKGASFVLQKEREIQIYITVVVTVRSE